MHASASVPRDRHDRQLQLARRARRREEGLAQRPSGPAAQRPSGPAAQRPSGPDAGRALRTPYPYVRCTRGLLTTGGPDLPGGRRTGRRRRMRPGSPDQRHDGPVATSSAVTTRSVRAARALPTRRRTTGREPMRPPGGTVLGLVALPRRRQPPAWPVREIPESAGSERSLSSFTARAHAVGDLPSSSRRPAAPLAPREIGAWAIGLRAIGLRAIGHGLARHRRRRSGRGRDLALKRGQSDRQPACAPAEPSRGALLVGSYDQRRFRSGRARGVTSACSLPYEELGLLRG